MASETFFKLWNARADIKNSNHLPRLLYTIARNTCIDFLRTSGRRAPGSHIIEKYASEIFESESDPSWILIQAETLRDFHELINRTIKEIQDMPNEYGKILRLFAIEQKKPVEIANMLGIRINTVKTHLVTARKQLRQRLEELGLPPDFIEKSTFSYFISQLHRNNI